MFFFMMCVIVIMVYIIYKRFVSSNTFSESQKENRNTKNVGSGWMQKKGIKEKAMNPIIKNHSDNIMSREIERYQKAEDYFYGRNGKPQDYCKALFFYEKAATEGHVESAYRTGCLRYYEYKGLCQDFVSAFKWFFFAAERGHVEAQRLLGECYANGYGIQENNELAAIWLLRAAEKNNDKAAKILGDICCQEMDWDNSYVWYNKAATLGNIPANLDLAFCYLNAWGVDRNINKVKSLLANFKNLCTQHNYIPTDTEKENKKRIEERIVEFEQHVAKEREDYKQKTQQLKDTPITGDFFRVDYNGYCIHTFNHDVCKHCSRRSWNDNHWEEGNRCRID